MTKNKALEIALEALELHGKQYPHMVKGYCLDAITAIKAALEAKDEPVAWMYWQSCLNDDGTQTSPWVQRYSKFKPPESIINKDITPLYTTPQSTWVGLTEQEQGAIMEDLNAHGTNLYPFAKTIEDKLKEKNT